MKNVYKYLFLTFISIFLVLVSYNYKINAQPKSYYKVYLDEEYIGMIESKQELEKYINNQAAKIRKNVEGYLLKLNAIESLENVNKNIRNGEQSNKESAEYIINNYKSLKISDLDYENIKYYIKEKLYNLNQKEIEEIKDYYESNKIYLTSKNVYTPNGIKIKKVYTYDDNVITVSEVYKKIISKKSCTIAGYKFTIKYEDDNTKDLVIYTTDTDIFSKALENLITIFVSDEDYKKYKEENQDEISSVGSILENIYVQESITYKAINISVDEKIYTDSNDLSAYLLYGDNFEQKSVKVKTGDSIESISLENKISVQEFLLFNSKYTNRDNLLVPNTEVIIAKADPKIQIVTESFEIVDNETDFAVVEQYDENLSQGSVVVTNEGEKGIERVSQNVKRINGEISYVQPVDRETIKSSVSKVISIGTKFIPNVGSTASWGWPTNYGYTLSSYYGYRLSVFAEGNFHSGIDIAGTGYGSPVYAANNGVIEVLKYTGTYGNHIIINHNNGYYSLYAHMAGFASNLSVGSTVSRGQTIGYVGQSGWATGPHLHFEIRTCAQYSCITNPLAYYR